MTLSRDEIKTHKAALAAALAALRGQEPQPGAVVEAAALALPAIPAIIKLIAALITITAAVVKLVDDLTSDDQLDDLGTLKDASLSLNDKAAVIRRVEGRVVLRDVNDGIVLHVQRIARGAELVIENNDGTVLVDLVEGTLTVKDNDDILVVRENLGTVRFETNDDTLSVERNAGELQIGSNADTIGVIENLGRVEISGNDDTISVDENVQRGRQVGRVEIKANNDSIMVRRNTGLIEVAGNAGGVFVDAEVGVIDNTDGVVDLSGNEGTVRFGGLVNGRPPGVVGGARQGRIRALD